MSWIRFQAEFEEQLEKLEVRLVKQATVEKQNDAKHVVTIREHWTETEKQGAELTGLRAK